MATMFFAVPTAEGLVCRHFGHCTEFTLIGVDEGQVVSSQAVMPPPHEPGLLPHWLGELGVTHIIAGGMGRRAQDLFAQAGVELVIGAGDGAPEDLVRAYLKGCLVTGDNPCDR